MGKDGQERSKGDLEDGAYDKKNWRDVIKEFKAEGLIPPPKNVRYRRSNSELNCSLPQPEVEWGPRHPRLSADAGFFSLMGELFNTIDH